MKLVFKQYKSNFITYEKPPLLSKNDNSNALKYFACQVKSDDTSMKLSLLTDKILRFDNGSFFNSLSGFSLYWDYKNNNEYISQKLTDSSTTDRINLKADSIDGSVLNGIRKSILYSFVSNKPPGYKIFCSPVTIHYKKINRKIKNFNNSLDYWYWSDYFTNISWYCLYSITRQQSIT